MFGSDIVDVALGMVFVYLLLSLICSAGAQGGAEAGLEGGDDFLREVGDLGVGERGFATLEGHADHQRIFSGRNIFAAEQVGGFDGRNFGNVESANGVGDFRECDAVG